MPTTSWLKEMLSGCTVQAMAKPRRGFFRISTGGEVQIDAQTGAIEIPANRLKVEEVRCSYRTAP